jgi:hypothetical protein
VIVDIKSVLESRYQPQACLSQITRFVLNGDGISNIGGVGKVAHERGEILRDRY